ncbi:MAG: hypothetical protein O2968_00115 [Acidobacteria bacterium]|nr:hypothetical protein [Acidobacteriota bacterium]
MRREASYYSKMAVGWWKFIRTPAAPDARAVVRQGLAEREKNFLDLLKRAVFESTVSPYRKLFAWADCSYLDVEQSVHRNGLEAALEQLRRAGIYLTHDEFKGKKPIVRGANSIEVHAEDFTNPLAKGVMEGSSSGSRSRGTISPRSLEHLHHREAQESLYWEEFGVYDRSIVMLMQILPSSVGLRRAAGYVRRGGKLQAWFTIGGRVLDAHYHAVTKFLVLESRLAGLKLPYPVPLPHNDFSPVARWIAKRKAAGERVAMMSNVSSGVRVAAAAVELGLDVSGSQFFVGAEALTDAKQETIERAGASAHARYGCSEIGLIGMACPQMRGNCVHLMEDSLAVLSHRKLAPLSGVEVDSLLFTTLRAWAPLVLVNAEMDDAGTIGPASCECGLKSLGLTKQVNKIFSYGKLTGQGTTLVGGDILNILEKILPERFGGVPTDYQLVEKEGSFQTEIELRVHPRLGLTCEEDVKRVFLHNLKKVWGGSMTERHWTRTEGVRVVFAEPFLVGSRKVLPLHLLGTAEQERERSR